MFNYMLFPISILLLEIVFHFSTCNEVSLKSLFVTGLFSLAYGGILNLCCMIIPWKRVRAIIMVILLLLITIPFGVEFFVFRQFNIYYDVNTIIHGSGNVVNGFMGEVAHMVFSVDGLIHLALFLFPLIIVILLIIKMGAMKLLTKIKFKNILFTSMITLLCFVSAMFLINNDNVYQLNFDKEYNYQYVVTNFGLTTGIIKDTMKMGKSENTFEIDEEVEEEVIEVEPEIVYEKNVMDIDFASLATTDAEPYASLDSYVASLTPSSQNEYTGLFVGKNLIMICAEAFSGYVIDENLTPTLYRLAHNGINFNDYYVIAGAGTTGGECELLFGLLPTQGGNSVLNTQTYNNYFTMGNQLNRLGYYGQAFHDNGCGAYDRYKTHQNLGYSAGFMGLGSGMEAYVTETWPESDLEMMQGTWDLYKDQEHFNIYYMTVSGHSGYRQDDNYIARKNYDRVAALECSETIKCYLSCNLELEDALTFLVNALEEKGIADNTVIVLTADHFPYGLDTEASYPYLAELYGEPITDAMVRDQNTLIIWSGSLEDEEPIVVDEPVSNIDILPTLSNLFGLEFDSRLLPGRDVFSDASPLVFNLNYDWKTDLGTYIASTNTFTPVNGEVEIPEDYVENIKKVVRNKVNFCDSELLNDYYGHLFNS